MKFIIDRQNVEMHFYLPSSSFLEIGENALVTRVFKDLAL